MEDEFYNNLKLMKITRHGEVRKAQRAINGNMIEYILKNGEVYHAGTNALAYWVNRKITKKHVIEQISEQNIMNAAVIISSETSIITVMHIRHRPKHWKAV